MYVTACRSPIFAFIEVHALLMRTGAYHLLVRYRLIIENASGNLDDRRHVDYNRIQCIHWKKRYKTGMPSNFELINSPGRDELHYTEFAYLFPKEKRNCLLVIDYTNPFVSQIIYGLDT